MAHDHAVGCSMFVTIHWVVHFHLSGFISCNLEFCWIIWAAWSRKSENSTLDASPKKIARPSQAIDVYLIPLLIPPMLQSKGLLTNQAIVPTASNNLVHFLYTLVTICLVSRFIRYYHPLFFSTEPSASFTSGRTIFFFDTTALQTSKQILDAKAQIRTDQLIYSATSLRAATSHWRITSDWTVGKVSNDRRPIQLRPCRPQWTAALIRCRDSVIAIVGFEMKDLTGAWLVLTIKHHQYLRIRMLNFGSTKLRQSLKHSQPWWDYHPSTYSCSGNHPNVGCARKVPTRRPA